MPTVDINDMGSVGVIKDVPPHQLPPEAWSTGTNVRVIDDSIGRIGGYTQVFGDIPAGNDSFTKILLHFDGVDGAQVFTDSNAGGSAHTWTASEAAVVTDDAQKKFGATSLFCDGVNSFISTGDHADFTIGSNDCVADCWFNRNGGFGTAQIIFGQGDLAINTNRSLLGYVDAGNLVHVAAVSGLTTFDVASTTAIASSGWHHVALVVSNHVVHLFLDGVSEGTPSTIVGSVNDSSNSFGIGTEGTTTTLPFNGWIDEFRLSVGTDRGWTGSSITVPSREHLTATQVAPHFLVGITTPAQMYWVYTSLVKAFVTDGTTHTNITRQTSNLDVAYTAAATQSWNATILGGILILNNGNDVPQFWATSNPATRLADLTNWPSTLRARVIRAFGPYLMALNTTTSGANAPHNMRWSHPADPGTVPSSWDITDPTVDAGSVDFPDVESGIILDGLPLQGRFYVYKENAVWRVRVVGGRFIFDQDAFLETIGLLCTRSVAVTSDGKRHIFAGQDNLWMHDGNNAVALLDKKHKRTLFSAMDTTSFATSFMMIYPLRDEAWFCYPEVGNSQPNRAMIVNTRTGQVTEADCDWRWGASGIVQVADTALWSTATEDWDSDTAPWSAAARRAVVLVNTDDSQFNQLDAGSTRDGVEFTGTVQRTGLGIIGRKRNGEWIEDFERRKLVTRVWPKVSGGVVSVRVGASPRPDGSVAWSSAQTFDFQTQQYVDVVVEGAAIAIEFSGATPWKLDGYKIDMSLTGNF